MYPDDGKTTMDYNSIDKTEVETVIFQEQLLDLSNNEDLKVIFKSGYQKLWLQAEISEEFVDYEELQESFCFTLIISTLTLIANLETEKKE
nr:unnamed protein product [Callosobruchus analis]